MGNKKSRPVRSGLDSDTAVSYAVELFHDIYLHYGIAVFKH